MADVIAFELRSEYEDFSGGNVSIFDGQLYDVGEALEAGEGKIVLGTAARKTDDDQIPEAEEERAYRDARIVDALDKYPALKRCSADDAEPPSYANVNIALGSGPTLADLKERAGELEIPGRSKMNRDELSEAIAAEEARIAEEGGAAEGDDSTEGSDD